MAKDYKKIHRDYIGSKKWLLKKTELINTYLKEGWEVECLLCGSTNHLQVHHTGYVNFGNEILTDERIWDLVFLCNECHRKTHQEAGYFDKRLSEKVGF